MKTGQSRSKPCRQRRKGPSTSIAPTMRGSMESWSNTVENYGMTWANVMAECPDGPRSSKVWAEYGMLGVPWNYLIDASTGDIVAKNLHGDELVAKLESLFGMD